MTTIEKTPLGRLDQEGRLLNAVLKSPTTKPAGGFGFRGDIALKFQAQLADEKRPPEFSIEQVLTIAQEGEAKRFPFWQAICTPSLIWNRSLKSLATF